MSLEMSNILPSAVPTEEVSDVDESIVVPTNRQSWCLQRGRQLLQIAGGIVLLSLSLSILYFAWSSLPEPTSPRVDYFDSILHNESTCQTTAIFPFRVACPKECKRAVDIDEPMYRMSIAWYFARPGQPEGTAYDLGINYQCPQQLVANFNAALITMGSILSTPSSASGNTSSLHIGPQERIHMSLSYLCCMRRNETDWAREVMYQWVLENQPFDFDLRFEKLQCWHESHNSVTVIIIGDDATQRTMMKFNQDLKQKLYEKGVSMEIDRSEQMPFHMTLAQVYRGAKAKSSGDEVLLPEEDIRPFIPDIFHLVSNVSHAYGNQWTGGERMRVRHSPYFASTGQLHAGREAA